MRDKALITSALPYANGEIHLGHVASTYLPADVTTRYLRMKGVEAYFVCASDDYGTPILIQSEREKKTPQEYSAHWNKRDLEDFTALSIDFDLFSRTSSKENAEFVQYVFDKLNKAGHIYHKEIIQYYCTIDKKFLPDRYVQGTCPKCGAKDQYSDLCEKCGSVPEDIIDPKCILCGQTPIMKPTKHYFFHLKQFAKPLESWLVSNTNLQSDIKKYVKNWIKEGLVDWDVTRDITWGVPIPLSDAAGKVFYGWFDNHLAYISTTTKLLSEKGIDGQEFWNSADIYHFIGKDIVYHHYLFLPAIRMGIDSEYKLPDYIPTRGHLSLQSKKISKSRNWYIGLRDFLKAYPADYLRFYLLFITPYSQDDLNFDLDDFAARINSELIGNLGNFVNRSLGFAVRTFGGIIPEPAHHDSRDEEAREEITQIAGEIDAHMALHHTDRALKRLIKFSASFNQYFQYKEPWKDREAARSCIFYSANAVHSIALALYPFMPNAAGRIWRQLGIKQEITSKSWTQLSTISIKPGHKLGDVYPLFKKVDMDDIERQKTALKEH
ncbi:MAG: methionine--tRNA ligase [Cenarchaeum sp. SB0673_bin_9]|nr:methionine--tRNA ligase [Cenarchaeum sp. SB0673_bin_9]